MPDGTTPDRSEVYGKTDAERKKPLPRKSDGAHRRKGRWASWLVWHAAIVVALIAFAVAIVVLTPRGEGFNFLIVVPLLPLIGLGLPWSALSVFLLGSYLVDGKAAFWAFYTSPALLNLALHALIRRRRAVKAARPSNPPTSPECDDAS